MSDRLTDAQLRAAAARRPGYATYPEYLPGRPERLAPYWRGAETEPVTDTDERTVTRLDILLRRPLPPVPEHCYPPDAVELPVEPPAPVAVLEFPGPLSAGQAAAVKLAALPPSRVFDFQPARSPGRRWWRRRWNWCVIADRGRIRYGYTWTERGASRRSARHARRWSL